jgi:thiol-disulfide isomerase/thioredoxin
MKKTFFFALILFSVQSIFAQSSVEVSRDASGTKILKGFMNKKELAADTAFGWYAQNIKSFTPNADVVKQYSAGKEGVSLVVFGGTWCGDTQVLLPKFFATTDAAGVPENHITLIGVDRSKKTLFNLAEAFAVTNVPTFIVMKDGKEVGRVVEYGKTGMPEKEVGEIIANATKK